VGLKMHKIANEIINERISEVVDNYDFEKQIEINPNGCPLYQQNQKCHNIEDLNCFFCYCPKYDRTVKEGKCKIDSPKGKYIEGIDGKIFDCSDCDYPHKKENAIKLFDNLFR